jgi:hypothetical protein
MGLESGRLTVLNHADSPAFAQYGRTKNIQAGDERQRQRTRPVQHDATALDAQLVQGESTQGRGLDPASIGDQLGQIDGIEGVHSLRRQNLQTAGRDGRAVQRQTQQRGNEKLLHRHAPNVRAASGFKATYSRFRPPCPGAVDGVREVAGWLDVLRIPTSRPAYDSGLSRGSNRFQIADFHRLIYHRLWRAHWVYCISYGAII